MDEGAEVQLTPSRALTEYAPCFAELAPALGERFAESIANWCGIGERPYPLAYWDVWVVHAGAELAGVASLYRRVEDPPTRCWIGWFGLLTRARGRGYGQRVLQLLEVKARAQGAAELCVYTDQHNVAALRAYARAGFGVVSYAETATTGRSADPTGVVLAKRVGRPARDA